MRWFFVIVSMLHAVAVWMRVQCAAVTVKVIVHQINLYEQFHITFKL